MLMKIFSYLGCSCRKGQNLNFVYIPNHNVVRQTTLVCTAVYNANTLSGWLIMINLDQSVLKKLLRYKCRQTTIKIFNKQFFST